MEASGEVGVGGWGGVGHKISLIRVSITWMSAEPDARFSPSLSHTGWVICSLTHLVNWYISHFKSYVHNDMLCIPHYSCLQGSTVRGERSKQSVCRVGSCVTSKPITLTLCVQIPLKIPPADSFTTVWGWYLSLLCFAVSQNSFCAVCWSLNSLLGGLFVSCSLVSYVEGWSCPGQRSFSVL